jgi:hypothetical protein
MAHRPRSPETDDEAPTPRWVYAVGIVVILLVMLLIGTHFSGGVPSH